MYRQAAHPRGRGLQLHSTSNCWTATDIRSTRIHAITLELLDRSGPPRLTDRNLAPYALTMLTDRPWRREKSKQVCVDVLPERIPVVTHVIQSERGRQPADSWSCIIVLILGPICEKSGG